MKKILFIIIVFVSLIIINNLVRSIYTAWQKKDLVTEAEKKLSYLKQENLRLKSELSYSETPEFLEKQARNELFLVKPGEEKVLASEILDETKTVSKKTEKPNWRKWLELFL